MVKKSVMAASAALVSLGIAGEANATQLCGWMVEKLEPNDVHHVELFLGADREIEFLYRIAGQGMVGDSGHMHSPSRGTFLLHAGQTDSPWSFGATLTPPGKIDIVVEIHQKPADIFDRAPTPLLAQFAFRRNVREGEKRAPATFAKKQCATVK